LPKTLGVSKTLNSGQGRAEKSGKINDFVKKKKRIRGKGGGSWGGFDSKWVKADEKRYNRQRRCWIGRECHGGAV